LDYNMEYNKFVIFMITIMGGKTMTVNQKAEPLFYYNYFLALEEDLERLSRFIEFNNDNLSTYSIELAHLLLAASSEVDVILKEICHLLDPSKEVKNINDYRKLIKSELPQSTFERFLNQIVLIPRHNLDYVPWLNWGNNQNPCWWQSYNDVKHERNIYFSKANLQNVLNSIGGLLVVVFYYYWLIDNKKRIMHMSSRDEERTRAKTIKSLKPDTNFIKLKDIYNRKWLRY